MLSGPELAARRETVEEAPDLARLLENLTLREAAAVARDPAMPQAKALLSTDGGICRDDGMPLEFDPWASRAHRCPRCGRIFEGERHDRAWARFQHLWLAGRAASLATLAALAGDRRAADRAAETLRWYGDHYFDFPNRDNVLGPSRLFFSTYLESIWIADYLAAAVLLRESDLLGGDIAEAVSAVADEAATLIGEFDEGFSNRQTWHNAALAAIAVWFEDEDLAGRAVEGPTGILAHLLRGFGPDGMWYEGENYHLFALRGQLLAMGWARQAGVDLLADERLASRLAAALRAPALTALPDLTFPARKDSRFGVSLAQPMYLELWEIGLAWLGDASADLWSFLRELYASPAPVAERFDSYLHDAGFPPPTEPRTRADLSWWALLEMAPELPSGGEPWSPGNRLLEGQGLAILRDGSRYASLECGPRGGGHGHADRLHLTLHAGGRYWLPDFGAGSYVTRDLFWYRSTLAHNAPRLDGASQPPLNASCAAFDVKGPWAYARGTFGLLARTLVAGPSYFLDLVELSAGEDHLLELSWHLQGEVDLATPGRWEPATLDDEFVSGAESFQPAVAGPVALIAREGGAGLSLYLAGEGQLLRAAAPGAPGGGAPVPFYLLRSRGRNLRLITVLQPTPAPQAVRGVTVAGESVEVQTVAGADRHLATAEGWQVYAGGTTVRLAGLRREPAPPKPLIDLERPVRATALAPHVAEPPALDGTLYGFRAETPLPLDLEDQYRRSEEPYPGPEMFAASALVNWDDRALYLAVEVMKPGPVYRAAEAPPLRLDNEPDEIHSDGIQVYLRPNADGPVYGFLIVPADEAGTIRVRPTTDGVGDASMVRGAWSRAEAGYAITVAIALPGWDQLHGGHRLGFDLHVNRMEPDRLRRAGQLVWSGGGGWVYLRGDRHDPARLGLVELA